MGRRKTSIVWQVPTDELQRLLDSSDSLVDVLKQLGLDPRCGNHKTLHARVKQDGLTLSRLITNRSAAITARFNGIQKVPDELVFREGVHFCRKGIKRRLIERGFQYICSECGVGGEYNRKPLSLQLDHINGINDDNRISNLRFLCPNCHSQTDTFGTKKLRQKIYESNEARQIRIVASRKFNPGKEELEVLIGSMPVVRVGRHFGVSDAAVRKRCRLLGIDIVAIKAGVV